MSAALGLVVAAVLQAAPQPDRPSRVELSPTTATLDVGEVVSFEARAFDGEGNELEARTLWFVTDREVLQGNRSGEFEALRPGEVSVFAVVRGVRAEAVVSVRQLPASQLVLEAPSLEIVPGTGVPLSIRAVTELGDTLSEIPRLSVSSSNLAVARVIGRRLVGLMPGVTSVQASAGELTVTAEFHVRGIPAASFVLASHSDRVRTGDVVHLVVRGLDDEGREVSVGWPVWSVSGEAGQASVYEEDREGVFVAQVPGTYEITADIGPDNQVSATIAVEPRAAAAGASLTTMGRGPISEHHSGDTWVFEGVDGRDYAYIGTFMYDWMKVWDVTDPTRPILTDSLQLDARRINDVKIHPNNRLGILTREQASDRRNGIVLLDLSDPAHPSIQSEYTETVTGGVHNVWVTEDDLVYACHNGTSDLHIIDISDPSSPKEVGRWGLESQRKVLHDVIVQDGYAYLSYWDDGLVTLDVGAGTHGGTPTEPVFVSRFSYPGGHTHTAFRSGRYLFVGDEIFPADWDADVPIDTRGYVHVLDMEDPEYPREVARYEVPEAGAHNFWVAEDRLYVGYYQAGLRVVDVSGELRGDLYRQGREIATLRTTDSRTMVPDWPMTWGAQLHKGNIYTSDLNSGLWIARLQFGDLVP